MKALRRFIILNPASLVAASPLLAQQTASRVASTGDRSPHETTSAVIGDRAVAN